MPLGITVHVTDACSLPFWLKAYVLEVYICATHLYVWYSCFIAVQPPLVSLLSYNEAFGLRAFAVSLKRLRRTPKQALPLVGLLPFADSLEDT